MYAYTVAMHHFFVAVAKLDIPSSVPADMVTHIPCISLSLVRADAFQKKLLERAVNSKESLYIL